jgi:hypothetical protein
MIFSKRTPSFSMQRQLMDLVTTKRASFDPLRAVAHPVIEFTCRTEYVISSGLFAEQHVPCISDFFIIEAFNEAVLEGITAEVAPVIHAATQDFSIPVDLRVIHNW